MDILCEAKSSIKNYLHKILLFVIVTVLFIADWSTILPEKHLPTPVKAFSNTFHTSGSWIAPTGITQVTIEAWGGGGGGGGRYNSTGASGGGGGGAYAKALITVTPGYTYNFTVGGGGAGTSGVLQVADGGDGENTYWEDGSGLLAAGGKGGSGDIAKGMGGLSDNSVGDIKYSGGNGGDGETTVGGGGGGGATSSGGGNNADGQIGGEQNAEGGAGGNGGSNTSGAAGVGYGGGGGGAGRSSSSRYGGAGAGGVLKITYESPSDFSMQTGSYIGNADTQSITNLGFTPEFVLIKSETTSASARFKTSLMPVENMAFMTGTEDNYDSNLVLDGDGFTVGSDVSVNASNVRYLWIAFAGSDCSPSGIFCIGQYTGNGSSPRQIHTGFDPDFVMVKRTTNIAAHFHTSSQPDDETLYFITTARNTTGAYIRSFTDTGYIVGTSDNVLNATYNYIAFKNSPGIFQEGIYTGDANDDRNITGVGFDPDIVMVTNSDNSSNSNTGTVMYTHENFGDYGSLFTGTTNTVNTIQKFVSDGFQVGSTARVNGLDNTLYYMAFNGIPSPPAPSGTFSMKVGSYTGSGSSQSISTVGFRPDLVIVKNNAETFQVFRTSLMRGDITLYLANNAGPFSGGITSLDNEGFSLGADATVNTDGDTYHYQAFGNAWNTETKTGSTDFAVGAYSGSGADNRDMETLPWEPHFVATKRSGSTQGVWRSTAHTGDLTSYFHNAAEITNSVQALLPKGFQVGTNPTTNNTTNLYYFFAFRTGPQFNVGSYIGDASDTHDITDVGFEPDLLWIKRSSSSFHGVSRPKTLEGDSNQYFSALSNNTGRVLSLLPEGFRVGGNISETNVNSMIYRWAAWRNASEIAISISITTDGIISYGTLGSGESITTLDLSETQTARNDSSIPVDLNIKTDIPSGWALGSTAASDTFVHEFSTNNGDSWTQFLAGDSYQLLTTNLSSSSDKDFDLRFTAPDPSTSSSEKTMTITIQAVEN